MTAPFTLTPRQLDEFDRRGVLRLPGLLSADRVGRARDYVQDRLALLGLWRDGAWRLDGRPRPQWPDSGVKGSKAIGNRHPAIEGLLDELRPSAVVVERIFFQTNVRTAISVAQASGVVLAAAARRGIEVAQYTPNEVKQGVVGSGGASKAQVQAMVARLCGLSEPPRPPDVADALALAACHLSSDRFRAAVKAASA